MRHFCTAGRDNLLTAFVMPNEMHWKEGGMAPQRAFDPHPFLAKVSTGRTVVAYQEQRPIFSRGEAGRRGLLLATSTALTDCSLMRIEQPTMLRVLHQETLAEMIGTTRSRTRKCWTMGPYAARNHWA